MPTSFVDLTIGIPKELSIHLSETTVKQIVNSHLTRMLLEISPEFANAETLISLTVYLETTSDTALHAEGNNTVQ